MLLNISHRTTYSYEEPVPYGLMQVRLAPQSGSQQEVRSWTLEVAGATAQVEYEDHHGNLVTLLGSDRDATEISLSVHGDVETTATGGVTSSNRSHAPLWLYKRQTAFTEPGPEVGALAGAIEPNSVEALHMLSARILSNVKYVTGSTSAATSAEESAANGAGVCQDHAQIFVSACRLNAIPARYVSGYLMMNETLEANASHAWAEAWVDGLGWVGFDVSNGISPDERYVRIAVGLDYVDVAPITGLRTGSGGETLDVQVEIVQQQ